MRGPHELVDGHDAGEAKAACDQLGGVTRIGRGIAGNSDNGF